MSEEVGGGTTRVYHLAGTENQNAAEYTVQIVYTGSGDITSGTAIIVLRGPDVSTRTYIPVERRLYLTRDHPSLFRYENWVGG